MTRKLIRSTFILLIICFIIFVFAREVSTLHFLSTENNKSIDRIEKLSRNNSIYREKIDAIKNEPKYIEKIIRDELGMIKEGEKIYKFNK